VTKDKWEDQTNGKIESLGDSAIVIRFGTKIEYEIHRKVQAVVDYLQHNSFQGFIECIPAYTSVTILYNPLQVWNSATNKERQTTTPSKIVRSIVEDLLMNVREEKRAKHRVVEIPVCYGGECGPDLDYVAKVNHLSKDEVISLHSTTEYLVYMLGFSPGFPFLGGMAEELATPRRNSPRTAIPAGSVGIAGGQTGIYPITTPGGWRLIGQTPLQLFLPENEPPSLLAAGDIVKFYSISYDEFMEYKGGGL